MNERPIIMTADEVRALLDGRKTQARRPILLKEGWAVAQDSSLGPVAMSLSAVNSVQPLPRTYGQPGDLLYVQETWAPGGLESEPRVYYKSRSLQEKGPHGGWRSPVTMPKWAARIWLLVTDMRAERLQDISGPDCVAEGVDVGGMQPAACGIERDHFRVKWNTRHAKRGLGYDTNPWVWVPTFERTEAPAR